MGWWVERKPVLVMLSVDLAFAVMNIVIKKVMDEGMDRLVLITLRQLMATLFMAPIAYFYERKTRPKLTLEICIYLFFSAVFGATLTQYLFFLGLHYTSATFACAFLNIAPVFTFLISLALRLESLSLRSPAGMTKALGTVVCVMGVLVLTLYRGAPVAGTAHQWASGQPSGDAVDYTSKKWLAGALAILAGCLCWSFWFPLQCKLGKKYPALYSGAALVFFFGFLQAASLSLATQRSLSTWMLKTKLEIITVVFTGVVGSGLCFLAMSWCVEKRGPVFTAAFTPLVQIMVAGFDFSFLHEQIYLGSVLGSVLVITGLYFLLWGKSREAQENAVKPADDIGESQVQLQAA